MAAPAVAAPPQVYEYEEECYTDTFEGDVYSYCFSGTTTFKVNEKSNGTYSLMSKDTFRSTSYMNGVLEGSSVSTSRSSYKVREGVTTKYSSRYRGTSDFGDGECTYTSRFKVIKGVVKADSFRSDCDFI